MEQLDVCIVKESLSVYEKMECCGRNCCYWFGMRGINVTDYMTQVHILKRYISLLHIKE